eukprot:CAMPEP_0206363222 /NCGR_PEP_ID=MMETSP0294-20121207/1465_1 /ASSEMBLY_ACC=CAM_ASM_000327 /TAXON_ID=39354 /ORGANISM="Heterosigma akashiwo, Strain CCMP2393" /LENGTH=43 /DNA_ID= /DNA_START= /DNA_END= /DNA_ORIENTATION=
MTLLYVNTFDLNDQFRKLFPIHLVNYTRLQEMAFNFEQAAKLT